MSDENNMRSIVNSSGFLFQLRIAHQVEETKKAHGWDVLAEELPWQEQNSGRGGYIDLVLGKGLMRMVIECKRVKEGAWVFLLPNAAETDNDDIQARCMWIKGPDQLPLPDPPQGPVFRSGWFDFYPQPPSYMAGFCAIRGKGEDDMPMLERIASKLIDAVECLAVEEIMVSLNSTPGHRYVYIPMIVTNADLQVCRFRTDEVDLSTGKISEGEFESVPFIRFYKSLTTQLSPDSRPSKLKDAHEDKMRTVLVVNSAHLAKLLEEWHFGREYQPPWGTVPGF